MKSNPSAIITLRSRISSRSDFIHHRWISPVKDGFDCVFSVKDNTLSSDLWLLEIQIAKGHLKVLVSFLITGFALYIMDL